MIHSMFDRPVVKKSLTTRKPSIRAEFDAFHANNPHVFTRLREMAFTWKRAGHECCGMKMLFEVLRWEQGIRTKGNEYVLNNNYTAHYARLLMQHESELDGFFKTRVDRRHG